jgi:selenocysteine-specific translation elongation factor
VELRSVQVHDIDRKEAGCGERVGLALRGVEADELERGQVLAPEGSLREGTRLAGGPLARCRYYRGDAAAGGRVHLGVGLQMVPGTLEESTATAAVATADRPVVHAAGQPVVVMDLSVPAGPRIVGTFPLA